MASIGKTELVRLASKKTDLGQPHMKIAYECFMEAIQEQIKEGNIIVLDGIGRLIPMVKAAGTGRNPRTGEMSEYPARLMLKFSVNANFKMALREVAVEEEEEEEQAPAKKAPARSAGPEKSQSGKAKNKRR